MHHKGHAQARQLPAPLPLPSFCHVALPAVHRSRDIYCFHWVRNKKWAEVRALLAWLQQTLKAFHPQLVIRLNGDEDDSGVSTQKVNKCDGGEAWLVGYGTLFSQCQVKVASTGRC